ncbi:clan AA aspartic protease [Paraburkholderia sp. RP-4-7]|uniref:Clan AA aspartic protease n=2 Tax=Paraburkholderia polaris TaxID=2728848 RepID=A0A848ING3_9BURK|nr:clan AA aspartic protease [Paraburkholderia polaris]
MLACAQARAQIATTQPDNNCHLTKDATLPLTEISGHYHVPVDIGGQTFLMVVDSGAEDTVLTPEAADLLHLSTDMSKADVIRGVGDTRSVYPRVLPSLKFGTEEWPNTRVEVANLLTAAERAAPSVPIGLIGARILSRYDVEFDFPAKTMTLYTAQGCTGRFVPWVGNYDAYSPIATPRNRFILSLALNGRPIKAVLDTGASRSLLKHAALQAVDVDEAALASDRQLSGTGVAGNSIHVYVHRFDSLRVGRANLRNAPIEVGDAALSDSDMLLGMDFLRWRRVWLSYSTGSVFMQLASGRAGAAPAASQAAPASSQSVDVDGQLAAIGQTSDAPAALPLSRLRQFSTHSHITYYPNLLLPVGRTR